MSPHRQLLLRATCPRTLGLGLAASSTLLSANSFRRKPLLCDSPAAVREFGNKNENVWRQVSGGSILGLIGGLALSAFSKTLAMLLGLLVLGVQFAASKGYNIIPTNLIQRYVKGINIRSALRENVAFKLSFGTSFMLAALAKF